MNAKMPPNTSQTKSSCTLNRAVGKSKSNGFSLWNWNSSMPMVVAANRNRKPQKMKKCISPGYSSRLMKRRWPKMSIPASFMDRLTRSPHGPRSAYSLPSRQMRARCQIAQPNASGVTIRRVYTSTPQSG